MKPNQPSPCAGPTLSDFGGGTPISPAVFLALACLLAVSASGGIPLSESAPDLNTPWLATVSANGGITASRYDFTQINQPIPDGEELGVTDTRSVATGIKYITDLNVWLEVQEGFIGDFYISLEHNGRLAVLLNRLGRRANSGVEQYGYGDSGLSVTLDDQAAQGDIHVYRLQFNLELPPAQRQNIPLGGPLTGTWAPDGRTADPAQVLIESPRLGVLSQFNGLDANGSWTLFAADLEEGGVGKLTGWGLQVSGVPEPAGGVVAGLAALVWILAHRQKRWRVPR